MLNQCRYHVDRYRDVISTYINVESTLSVCWVFEFDDVPYNLRNQCKCGRSMPCTERYGIETTSSIGPKLWDKVPTEIKDSKSLEAFKAQIKSWVPKNCPYKICKLFIKHVGYL